MALSAFTSPLSPAASDELIDRVVASVNDEVITSTELEQEGEKIFEKIRQSAPASEIEETLARARKEVLEKMIDDLLITQKARELRIDVTNEELENTISTVSSNNGLTREQLFEELARAGVSEEEYKEKLADQVRRSKLVSYDVKSKIVISKEKARDHYDKVYTKKPMPAGYHILQIGFTWGKPESPSANREEAKLRAGRIRNLVNEGQDFRQLASSFSELPSSEDGGDLGFFTEDEMAFYMKKILVDLEPGMVSEIAEAPDSFQFFLLLAANIENKPRYAPYEFVEDEIRSLLYDEELNKRYDNWMEDIREQALIKELL